jgi:hypothetical protein
MNCARLSKSSKCKSMPRSLAARKTVSLNLTFEPGLNMDRRATYAAFSTCDADMGGFTGLTALARALVAM